MVAHIGRWQDCQDAKDIEDALLDGMIMQRRVVAPMSKIPMLRYAEAQIGRLADVDAGLAVEAKDAVKVDASAFELEITANALEPVDM
jgi:hypothetical protein